MSLPYDRTDRVPERRCGLCGGRLTEGPVFGIFAHSVAEALGVEPSPIGTEFACDTCGSPAGFGRSARAPLPYDKTDRRLVVLAIALALAAFLSLLFALPSRAAGGEDGYVEVALPDFALAPADAHLPTHLCTVGEVASVRKEKDGDVHVRLCSFSSDPALGGWGYCVVLEIIPELPIARPRKGSRIRACGIQRWDSAHRWQEIHPLLNWEEVR